MFDRYMVEYDLGLEHNKHINICKNVAMSTAYIYYKDTEYINTYELSTKIVRAMINAPGLHDSIYGLKKVDIASERYSYEVYLHIEMISEFRYEIETTVSAYARSQNNEISDDYIKMSRKSILQCNVGHDESNPKDAPYIGPRFFTVDHYDLIDSERTILPEYAGERHECNAEPIGYDEYVERIVKNIHAVANDGETTDATIPVDDTPVAVKPVWEGTADD